MRIFIWTEQGLHRQGNGVVVSQFVCRRWLRLWAPIDSKGWFGIDRKQRIGDGDVNFNKMDTPEADLTLWVGRRALVGVLIHVSTRIDAGFGF